MKILFIGKINKKSHKNVEEMLIRIQYLPIGNKAKQKTINYV
jgi:hypothetical protein